MISNYVPGLEDLPRCSSWSYKQSGSKRIDPSVRVSLPMKEKKKISQQIYEQNMGKGDEDNKRYGIVRGKRRRRTVGTLSLMVDRMEKGNGKEVTGREGGEGVSRRLPVRKGSPDLKDREVGEFSKPFDGRVRKFVCAYEDSLRQKNL